MTQPQPDLPGAQFLERAAVLHRMFPVADAHVDTVSEMLDKGYDLASTPETAHLSWEKIAAGGLTAQIFACFVAPDYLPDHCAERADRLLDRFEAETRRFPDRLAACRTAAEIEQAMAQGKLAGILSIEGGHAIENSLDTLRRFHQRGVRAMTLTWNNTHDWADGCGPMDESIPQHGGLTRFGEKVVGTMGDLGMAVDISHAAPATFAAVLESAQVPPFASHSCCRALNDHRRNLTDEQMRALADAGGVMGVSLVSGFLVDEETSWQATRQTPEYAHLTAAWQSKSPAEREEEEFAFYQRTVPRATLADAARHVDHALRVMGTEAVALGSDFDGARRFPVGLEHVGTLPRLTAALLERGWKERELVGFLGRNLLDYLGRVIG